MPWITVGILTFIRREAVLKAIQSAFDQGFTDMEFAVKYSEIDIEHGKGTRNG